MKKKGIFVCAVLISAFVNVLPLLLWKEKILFTEQSYVSLVLMFLVSLHGIFSYVFRHKGNFLSFGQPKSAIFGDKKQTEYTHTEKYRKEFFLQFLIYSIIIPFYLPCICFIRSWVQTLWLLCLIFFPQMIYILMDIKNMLTKMKEYKVIEQQKDQELKEQQKREEMGFFK